MVRTIMFDPSSYLSEVHSFSGDLDHKRTCCAKLALRSTAERMGQQLDRDGSQRDGTRHYPLPGPFCMAHAVGEAVRLVPLSASRLSFQPLCAWRQTPWQWRPASQRCGLILDHEEDPARASEYRLREPIGASDLSTRRCAEHEKNLLFSASRTARAKQHASPQRSGAQFEQGYACLRPVN